MISGGHCTQKALLEFKRGCVPGTYSSDKKKYYYIKYSDPSSRHDTGFQPNWLFFSYLSIKTYDVATH